MIIDANNVFSDAQALTASGAVASTNVIDTEAANSNLGGGTPIWLHCKVNTAFTSATSSTLIVDFEECATSGGTYVDVLKSETFTVGQLSQGVDLMTVPLPREHLRYIRMQYTQGVGSGFTAGAVDAFLAPSAPRT